MNSPTYNFAGLAAGFGTGRAIGAPDAEEETSTDIDILAEFREAAQDQAERESGPRRKAWLKLATAIENAEARFADDLDEIDKAEEEDAEPFEQE